jgi:hypothetical protein
MRNLYVERVEVVCKLGPVVGSSSVLSGRADVSILERLNQTFRPSISVPRFTIMEGVSPGIHSQLRIEQVKVHGKK